MPQSSHQKPVNDHNKSINWRHAPKGQGNRSHSLRSHSLMVGQPDIQTSIFTHHIHLKEPLISHQHCLIWFNIYSLTAYFVRHINAKWILYLNLKLDEVLKVQTTHWRLNYSSGHCLETRHANLCQLPSLTYVDVVCTCCTGWLFMNLTVFWRINTVMQIENMLNKYGWQSQTRECE